MNPTETLKSAGERNLMRSSGSAVEEKMESGFVGYPEVRSSLHPSLATNVALVIDS